MRFPLVHIAVLAAAACALPVTTARASGSLSLAGTRLTWTGTTSADTVTVSAVSIRRPLPPPEEQITFRSKTMILVAPTAASACGDSATVVECNRAVTGGNIAVIEADGDAGGDVLTFDDVSVVAGRLSLPVDFDGGPGDDTLVGSAVGDVELRGGTGDDTVDGKGGDDFIDGDDTDATTADGRDTIDGGTGDDNIEGQGANDAILGSDGNDTNLSGGPGNDTIQGGDGEDTINGGDDEDTVIAGPENDVVDGGAGNADRIRYDEPTRGGAVVVDLSNGTAGKDGGPGETTEDAVNFERVTGTALGDSIRGNDSANILDGRGGDDVLSGAGGSDDLNGGDGLDTASYAERAAAASVTVALDGVANDGAAGEGDDVGADVENAAGGAGNDALTGNDGPNVLDGGPGADSLIGLGGVDDFRAGAGDDAVDALDGNQERVDCGDGAGDRADADGVDQLSGCEIARIVARPAATPPPAQPAAPPPAPPVVDGDGDGVPAGTDCDDASPARHQGAAEIRGNAVDEDCDGRTPAFESVGATVARSFLTRRDRTQITRLTVKHVPAGAELLLRCKPPKRARRACPFERFSRKLAVPTAALKLLSQFERRRLPAGTVVEVRISAPQMVGRVLRWTMRDGKLPKEADLCLTPGRSAPARCPKAAS